MDGVFGTDRVRAYPTRRCWAATRANVEIQFGKAVDLVSERAIGRDQAAKRGANVMHPARHRQFGRAARANSLLVS